MWPKHLVNSFVHVLTVILYIFPPLTVFIEITVVVDISVSYFSSALNFRISMSYHIIYLIAECDWLKLVP